MKVGLVQHSTVSESEENIEKALAGIEEAARKGAQAVCLQELFAHPYVGIHKNLSHLSLAEPIPGPLTNRLSRAAQEHNIVLIGGSIFEKAEGEKETQYFNTAVVFNPQGEILDRYRKIHIPDDPHYREQFYFSSGNEGYMVVNTEQGKIGVAICYDQWFPEVSRILALEGAQVIFYPTAIGWTKAMKKSSFEQNADKRWINVQRGQAIANGVYVAAVNRVGKEEDKIKFWGQSFIADPSGEIIARGSKKKDGVIVQDCDLSMCTEAQSWGFMKNRQPGTYGGLLKK